jgi:hypothetical protein
MRENRFSNEVCYLSVENIKLWTINIVTKGVNFVSSEVSDEPRQSTGSITYDVKQMKNKKI